MLDTINNMISGHLLVPSLAFIFFPIRTSDDQNIKSKLPTGTKVMLLCIIYLHPSQSMCQYLSMRSISPCTCTSVHTPLFVPLQAFSTQKKVLRKFTLGIKKINKRQPLILLVYFLLHIHSCYLFTNQRPFSVAKEFQRTAILLMMEFADTLILKLMFSQ